MNDLDRLLSIESIRQLAYRYAWATDARDLDHLVSLFVDDVRVGREFTGRSALRENFDRQLRKIGISILSVGNHIIDFDESEGEGDDGEPTTGASGIVYCRGEIQVDQKWIVQTIQYQDRYERRNGEWLFVRRKHLLWYGAEVGENPLVLPSANWPENHTGRGSLPESLPSWQAFWRDQTNDPNRED